MHHVIDEKIPMCPTSLLLHFIYSDGIIKNSFELKSQNPVTVVNSTSCQNNKLCIEYVSKRTHVAWDAMSGKYPALFLDWGAQRLSGYVMQNKYCIATFQGSEHGRVIGILQWGKATTRQSKFYE